MGTDAIVVSRQANKILLKMASRPAGAWPRWSARGLPLVIVDFPFNSYDVLSHCTVCVG